MAGYILSIGVILGACYASIHSQTQKASSKQSVMNVLGHRRLDFDMRGDV